MSHIGKDLAMNPVGRVLMNPIAHVPTDRSKQLERKGHGFFGLMDEWARDRVAHASEINFLAKARPGPHPATPLGVFLPNTSP
jgi:hypothetical protein